MRSGVYDTIKFLVIRILVLFDALLRALRPRRAAVLRRIEGDTRSPGAHMLCLFAHYDRDGMIDDYVVRYLSELAQLGCEIVFVSTAPVLRAGTVDRIRRYCSRIILRENIGYDFGSWRDGLASCEDLSAYDRIVFANDSVYGPLRPLCDVFAKMKSRDALAWGITDSLRYFRHLQSYFMVFERPVVESEVFTRFWRELPDHRFKHVVVMQCEVGLSRKLTKAGFRLDALCEYRSVGRSLEGAASNGRSMRVPGIPVNATHWGWRALIEDYGCPFIKAQLLRDNPKRIADIAHWEDIVRSVSDYDTGLIRRHLDRVRR